MIDVLTSAAAIRDAARLHAVAGTGLDAQPVPWCDRLAHLAARALCVPVALLVLVERHRQVMPGAVGLPEPWQHRRETPLTHSVCQYVVGADAPLAFTDVRRDPVLHTSEAIRDLGVVAYAGVPVHDRDGHVLGALCAIDVAPRSWSAEDLALLARIAARCSRMLQSRRTATRPGPRPPEPPAAVIGPPARPGPDRQLWTPAVRTPTLVLDHRTRPRHTASGLTVTGRWHDEPVTVVIRTADHPAAARRFQRRLRVAQAFCLNPPRLPAEEHRWNDACTLVVSRPLGRPLQRHPGHVPAMAPGEWDEVLHLAALLSAWHPEPADLHRWTVDYHDWIGGHRRTGHLSPDEADRIGALLRRCERDRTFAHGRLTLRDVVRQPSRQLALTGFTHAGLYLAGRDLAALAFAAPDAAARSAVMRRVIGADIVEPFTVNLLLSAADVAARHPAAAPAAPIGAVVGARRHAHRLLSDLGL
ncbi:GAF domain-containing protein [Dactylosporangium sp. CS-047395]|uniref:GAF domain-containing protein n=1 Tax=Dactylosporangium sp. CS-047395 TaxID=3239936 RepID=UPI003D8A5CD1